MKNSIVYLISTALMAIASGCSSGCEYQTDHDLIKRVTEEINVLKAEKAALPFDADLQRDQYDLRIEQKSQEMDAAFGDCE